MRTEEKPKTIENYIQGTDPVKVEVITHEEDEKRAIDRGQKILATVRTEGFVAIYEHVKQDLQTLATKVMDRGMNSDDIETVKYQREVYIQRYRALKSLISWIEREIRNGEELKQELSKDDRSGQKGSESVDSGS